jgi:hypothetical protein
MKFLKGFDGDFDSLSIWFTWNDDGKEINLIPNGNSVKVTRNNVVKYIYSVSNYRLNI